MIQANRKSEDFFNQLIPERMGKPCCEIVGFFRNRFDRCPCLRSKQSKKREDIELKRGDEWLRVIVDPILENNGHYGGAVHTFRDITMNRQIEKALRESELKYHAWGRL